MDFDKALKHMKKIVVKTGMYQLEELKKREFEIVSKTTKVDLVTTVDKESEMQILSYLKKIFKDVSYLAEETKRQVEESEYRWVIDPIDGTTNYIQGLPIFTISLALQKNKKSVVGVVYNPYTKEMYWAVKNKGAYYNEEKIFIGSKEKIEECVLATGFSYKRETNLLGNLEVFNHFVPRVRGIRRMGSASYDMCNVARGALDGYWEMGLNTWDVAAGEIIIKEAGGTVLYFDKSDMVSLICGNDDIVGQIYKIITKEQV